PSACNGERACVAENDTSAWRRVLDVNVLGLSVCSREAVQLMRERHDQEDGDGYLVNINSIVGHMDWIKNEFSMYVASKNAVRSVSSGLVKTDFFSGYEKFESDDWFQMPHIFAEDIADAIHEMIVKPAGGVL
ncbi:Dehydrogenase/reductase SDR family member 11, partial [Gryllus bimaculatus]